MQTCLTVDGTSNVYLFMSQISFFAFMEWGMAPRRRLNVKF